ncbi:MAG TPA: single-stranded DNA-binding protein [Anaerolineae bacterium]|nr:single-stranded DNA-binding protein [Anaerolineae bacterium]
MYHKVIIVGHLGRDPEMRYTPDGTPVTTFSVATNRKWTSQDGSQGEETVWWRVTTWRKLAEICNQYLSKGRPVLIEGVMRPDPQTGGPRVWTGNDGVARASYEVTARTVKFLSARGEQAGAAPGVTEEEPPPGFVEENEIPF